MKEIKGLIVFFVNFNEENLPPGWEDTMNTLKTYHKELAENLDTQGYHLIFNPTLNEASRIEKVDFNKPISFSKKEI